MAILSFLMNEALSLYKRAAKLKASAILENEKDEPKDSVSISTESKRNQVIEQPNLALSVFFSNVIREKLYV